MDLHVNCFPPSQELQNRRQRIPPLQVPNRPPIVVKPPPAPTTNISERRMQTRPGPVAVVGAQVMSCHVTYFSIYLSLHLLLHSARVARTRFSDFTPFPHLADKTDFETDFLNHTKYNITKSIILLSFLRIPQMTFSEDRNVAAELGNGEGSFESDPRSPLGSRGHFQG